MTADFKALVDGMASMTCVVSVRKAPESGANEFRIVTGNRAYIDSIENPAPGIQMLTQKFVPNALYTDYMPPDLNFEDFCYRAAVEKKCLHSYAHPERMNVWFNMTFMPLESDDDISYCTYTMEINYQPDSERISNVSSEYASAVLGMAITLRSSDDFLGAVSNVATDIRKMCKSEFCGILLIDEEAHSWTLLGHSGAEDSTLQPVPEFFDERFYDIVATWPDTIAGSNCLIAKNEHEMEVVKQRNPVWHKSLMEGNIKSIALFPLKSHGVLLGYVWTSNFPAGESAAVKEALELTTYVLSVEIDNYLMVGQLKELGSKDALTGILNRNQMDIRLNGLTSGDEGDGQPVAVVFADLNGLKHVNDTVGHAAGDKLLKDGAAALLSVFDAKDVYRAGGDEFVVIESCVDDQQLADQIAALKEAEQEYDNVSFAIGCYLEPDPREVRRALRLADTNMYKDKAAHYGRS